MAYQKYYPNGWKSGEVGATPITPEALNNMENGIAAAVRTEDIVDNLTSTATNKPLSAKQGKVLNEAIAQSTAKLQYGTTTNSTAIIANTVYDLDVTYPTKYNSRAYPVVSLICYTDPSNISWLLRSYSTSGFTVRIKSVVTQNAGDVRVIWIAHGD